MRLLIYNLIMAAVDPDDWPRMFQGLPITAVPVTRSFEVAGIALTCLGEFDSFDASLQLESPDPKRFHIVLGHAPNFALGQVEADLLVAGHTHGGQVRLPVVGPLMTLAEVPRSWVAGLTDLPDGGILYVSRGVGMERGRAPRLRFLCRPKLVVIDLLPEGECEYSSNPSKAVRGERIHVVFRQISPHGPDESGHYERVGRILTNH